MPTDQASRKSVVVTHNTAHYIAMHYLEFIQELVDLGYQVLVVAPRDDAFEVLETAGASCHDLTLSRRGTGSFEKSGPLLYSTTASSRLSTVLTPRADVVFQAYFPW